MLWGVPRPCNLSKFSSDNTSTQLIIFSVLGQCLSVPNFCTPWTYGSLTAQVSLITQLTLLHLLPSAAIFLSSSLEDPTSYCTLVPTSVFTVLANICTNKTIHCNHTMHVCMYYVCMFYVCILVSGYVCVYVRMHTCTYVCMNVLCMHIYKCVCTCLYACMYIYVYVLCVCICMCMYACLCVCVMCVCVCVYVRVCVR